ncbi:hypothetical protein PCANC_25232 [Puccinia coronata f. sp. avenae]|uniref:Uncharacterized protein n=1 Tax=Puccinia coronata f. sp. avenae TaxID=200324 RepID=A0A2N5TPH7_9BASI|nr:hypothetical protein PCANC_25232 [Puccinia coronata f. sp. avenae]
MSFVLTSDQPTRQAPPGDSVVDFAKYVMGCAGGIFSLPPEPKIQEVYLREAFAVAFYRVGQEAADPTTQLLHPDYFPSQLLPHAKFTSSDKDQCDLKFRSKGFTQITFEWRKPSWTDSSWNSSTADILCNNYGIWILNQKKSSTFSFLDAKAELHEWVVRMNSELIATRTQIREGQDVVDHDFEANKGRHILYRQKVADSRFKTASTVFPNHPKLLAMLKDPDTVSNYEESEDITALPTRIVPSWRSPILTAIMRALDLASFQLAPTGTKRSMVKWLARGDERRATKNEVLYKTIPLDEN